MASAWGALDARPGTLPRLPPPLGLASREEISPDYGVGGGVNRVSQSTGEGAPSLVWGMPGGEGFLEESVLEPRLSSSWS